MDLLIAEGLGDTDEMPGPHRGGPSSAGLLPDGRNIALDAQLRGRILTHR
ncbi:hypothetical protein [Nocardia sputi]|nr:hypothetical protein [Nocardia sputi]